MTAHRHEPARAEIATADRSTPGHRKPPPAGGRTHAAQTRTQARSAYLTARSRDEYSRAHTEQERYWAAHRYLTAAAAALRRQDPATADAILHDVVRTLIHAGDTLTTHLATPRPRGSVRRPRGEPR